MTTYVEYCPSCLRDWLGWTIRRQCAECIRIHWSAAQAARVLYNKTNMLVNITNPTIVMEMEIYEHDHANTMYIAYLDIVKHFADMDTDPNHHDAWELKASSKHFIDPELQNEHRTMTDVTTNVFRRVATLTIKFRDHADYVQYMLRVQNENPYRAVRVRFISHIPSKHDPSIRLTDVTSFDASAYYFKSMSIGRVEDDEKPSYASGASNEPRTDSHDPNDRVYKSRFQAIPMGSHRDVQRRAHELLNVHFRAEVEKLQFYRTHLLFQPHEWIENPFISPEVRDNIHMRCWYAFECCAALAFPLGLAHNQPSNTLNDQKTLVTSPVATSDVIPQILAFMGIKTRLAQSSSTARVRRIVRRVATGPPVYEPAHAELRRGTKRRHTSQSCDVFDASTQT